MDNHYQPFELDGAEGHGTGYCRMSVIIPENPATRRPLCDCPEGHATCAAADTSVPAEPEA
ncbi:MAG: hypothetical protein AB7D37_10950 [Desulfovibrio sp.]